MAYIQRKYFDRTIVCGSRRRVFDEHAVPIASKVNSKMINSKGVNKSGKGQIYLLNIIHGIRVSN